MRIVGVVAEYDPFHRGHAWQLSEARRLAQADRVLVVMSGCFTQRGLPALLPTADRVQMALRCGADAVIALPTLWAVRDAEHFALGSIALLHHLGVHALSFGAETAEVRLLSDCARLLEAPDAAFQHALRQGLDSGLPHPAAISRAAEQALPDSGALLASPNNTLAVCYLRAMLRLGSTMAVCPVPRESGYHDTSLAAEALPSATALRGAILRGDWCAAQSAMPEEAFAVLRSAALADRVLPPNSLDQALLYRLRSMTADDWQALPGCTEGITDRLRAALPQAVDRESLLRAAGTRRYPHARLSRLCTHALLGMTQPLLDATPLPEAALLLGFRQDHRDILTALKQSGFPLIAKAADYPRDTPWFALEQCAYDLWSLAAKKLPGLLYRQGIQRV